MSDLEFFLNRSEFYQIFGDPQSLVWHFPTNQKKVIFSWKFNSQTWPIAFLGSPRGPCQYVVYHFSGHDFWQVAHSGGRGVSWLVYETSRKDPGGLHYLDLKLWHYLLLWVINLKTYVHLPRKKDFLTCSWTWTSQRWGDNMKNYSKQYQSSSLNQHFPRNKQRQKTKN